MQSYEALLSSREAVQHVRAVQRTIRRLGGSVKIAPPTATGLVLVTLTLPDGYLPRHVLPDLPFYPI